MSTINQIIQLMSTVINPASIKRQDGDNPPVTAGPQGDLLMSKLHGDYFQAAYRGNLYTANVTAVAIPVIANGLVSVFSLYNPVGSGIIMELVRTTLGQDAAATIVDAIGWYYDAGSRAAAATFTTKGTIESAQVGSGLVGKGLVYSALTHVNSAGWKRVDIIGSFGATTDAGLALPDKQHNGTILIPEGTILSVAASTTVTTASGLDIQAIWAEWPKP